MQHNTVNNDDCRFVPNLHWIVSLDIGFAVTFLIMQILTIALDRLGDPSETLYHLVTPRTNFWTSCVAGTVLSFVAWYWIPLARSFVSVLLCDGSGYRLPNGNENGTATFATLAGFALAQGAALTTAAKGQGRDGLVLSIYALAVVFSYFWTRRLVLSRPYDKNFDLTTHLQARYTLAWIVFLGTIMLVLGVLGALPNQTWRVPYPNPDIKCKSQLLTARKNDLFHFLNSVTGSTRDISLWARWLAEKQEAYELKAGEGVMSRLVWIEQSQPFDQNHTSFVAEVRCSEPYSLADKVAFLVKWDYALKTPVYRQLVFKRKENGDLSGVFDVREPSLDEVLVIVATVQKRINGKQVPIDRDVVSYGVTVELTNAISSDDRSKNSK